MTGRGTHGSPGSRRQAAVAQLPLQTAKPGASSRPRRRQRIEITFYWPVWLTYPGRPSADSTIRGGRALSQSPENVRLPRAKRTRRPPQGQVQRSRLRGSLVVSAPPTGSATPRSSGRSSPQAPRLRRPILRGCSDPAPTSSPALSNPTLLLATARSALYDRLITPKTAFCRPATTAPESAAHPTRTPAPHARPVLAGHGRDDQSPPEPCAHR